MIIPPVENHPSLGIVVAMTAAGVIGGNGKLPWNLPADRRLFRQLTDGGTVIMGRLTFESLPAPLVNRRNIVITRSGRHYPGVETAPGLREALELARCIGQPIFVIGGVALYREALPLADSLHVSWVDGEFAGDRHFPAFDLADWDQIDSVDYPGFRYVSYRQRKTTPHPAYGHPLP